MPAGSGQDHAQGAEDGVHRQPVAHEHGVVDAPRQIIVVAGHHVGHRRRRRVVPRLRLVDGGRLPGGARSAVLVQEQTSTRYASKTY